MMFRQWAIKQYGEFISHPLIYIAGCGSIAAGIVFWKQDVVVFAVFLWAVLVIVLFELRAARKHQQDRIDKIATELDKSRIIVGQIAAELSNYKIVMELMAGGLAQIMAAELTKLAERDPRLRNTLDSMTKKKMPPSVGPH